DNVDAVGDSGIDGDGDDDDDGVEDDEVLVPRGGPIPVPSPLTPRGGAGVVGVGMGPFGRPTGRSMAAAALLRSTLTREREERRREHETLLELLRRAEEERGRRRGGASETRRRPDGNRSGDSRSGSASDSSLRGRDLETTAFARSYRGHDNTVDLAVPNASTTASSKRHRDVQREAPCESDRGRCMPPPPALPATPASLPLSSDAWQALIAGLEGSLLRAISSSRSSSSSSSCNNTCRNPCRRNHRRRRQPQPQPQPQLERGSSTERSSDINIRSATDGGSTTQRRRRR
ncbi:unnamed protein product, partial [Sphacelaria rigidula]